MIRTLVIGNDRPIRDTVKVGLAQAQAFHVEVAETGWALDLAKSKPFDCVIVDTSTDEPEALQLLKEVRRRLPEADLLLLTRAKSASRHLERDRKQLQVTDVIQLPIEPIEFFNKLSKLIQRAAEFARTE